MSFCRNRCVTPPTVDVYEALAYTIPGIYAHQSALQGGIQLKIPDYGKG